MYVRKSYMKVLTVDLLYIVLWSWLIHSLSDTVVSRVGLWRVDAGS